MAEHYYTNNPQSKQEIREFSVELRGKIYYFKTNAGVFSKSELDEGSKLLISVLPVQCGDIVLDVGCGYGPLGIVAADMVGSLGRVDMVDINQRAVQLSQENIVLNQIKNAQVKWSEGFTQVDATYDWVITNPPIRVGKKVIYQMVEDASTHLRPGGGLVMVIRTKQGAKSMANHIQHLFGNVETITKNKGYRILQGMR